MPIALHGMWEEVGSLVRIPFSSTVLQRRRGYRRVLQHFSRIRLAPMIPLDKDGMRDLLELKNIALLYELWTFFRLVHEISAALGHPPVRSGRLTRGHFQTAFAAGGTFEWNPGVRLVYNQRFSRLRRGQGHSYSVPLIPDIALRIPDGPNAGLHLFDAKFLVQALTDVRLVADDKDTDDEKAPERAGSFKRADIYKMHAYRDAIRCRPWLPFQDHRSYRVSSHLCYRSERRPSGWSRFRGAWPGPGSFLLGLHERDR